MKKILLFFFLILFTNTNLFSQEIVLKKAVIKVNELNCKMCVVSVERELRKIKGIKRYDISLDNETVTVRYDAKEVSVEDIIKAIEKTGYDAEEIKEK